MINGSKSSPSYMQSKLNVLLESLPATPLLTQFAAAYLQANSTRSLLDTDPQTFATFITDRFDFFISVSPQVGGIRSWTVPASSESATPQRAIEYAVPDAMYLVMTFTELFKEFGYKITKLLHPIMTVSLDSDGRVETISTPKPGTTLVSTTYIEFDCFDDEATFERFLSRFKQHLTAVQSAQQNRPGIYALLDRLKSVVATTDAPLAEPRSEWVNLLDWLQRENFSFYGYVAINTLNRSIVSGTGVGILSDDYASIDPHHVREILQTHSNRMRSAATPFCFDTIPVLSPVQRFEHLMRLSLKLPGESGVIEHNFVGLLKRSSLLAKNLETPIIHLKMAHIFESKHMLPGSYDYNEVIRIFTSIPKYELFRCSAEDLLFLVESILSITNPSDVYCFHRIHTSVGRPLLVVALPRPQFTRANIESIDRFLSKSGLTPIERVEINGDHTRLHYYFEDSTIELDSIAIQSELKELIKPWSDRLRDAIESHFQGKAALQIYARYATAFPDHHRVRRSPQETIRDIVYMEKIAHEGEIQFDIFPILSEGSSLVGKASVLSIYNREKIDLISILPVLQNMGIYVFDELTTRVGTETLYGYIHSFRVAKQDKTIIDEKRLRNDLVALLTAVFTNRSENDPLNALLLTAELNWRSINLFQTYRNVYLQLGTSHSRDKVNQVLVSHVSSTQALFRYFETKFSVNPEFGKLDHRINVLLPKAESNFFDTLSAVQEVSDDTILRDLYALIRATLRTNFYIPKPNDETFISIKLDSKQVPYIPTPAPYREIYVHDYGMEGTHLRFGAIARGGLRWSDRPDDFRREVLSLVKTQQTKNVVIVPVGSKGGFVLKRGNMTKEEAATESVVQYRKFVSGLLDITDNIDGTGTIQCPGYVVAYDEQDPYLVVAADKGTASFSDIANEISETYRFWLGDAFASGGTIGYNHKKEAITARGAWECVKLHFLEAGKNIEKEEFTVAGIGDMSGDVFGNGMLLSKNIRLQAAFNHVHIFVDPNPNAADSWVERNRLFNLPRSTWFDYDPTLISPGGGVFERKAKSIAVTPEMKDLFGIKSATVTGEALIQAILKMKVDLIWLGGIGTYFKATGQPNSTVGDPTNDSVRVDISECRAMVIGEGANLGVTQLARIEFSRLGGRMNTDAIDNSAGVNMSDYEVNIKILLKQLMEEGIIPSMSKRNQVLEAATNEVSDLVLRNNRGQHRLLSMDTNRSKKQMGMFIKMIQHDIASGFLDAKTEQIPDLSELAQWGEAGQALPRPVLAVVQAYTKMAVYNALLAAPILDNPYFKPFYESYFPLSIRNQIDGEMPTHRLHRNILATILTNKIVNQAGMLFFFEMQQLTGKSIPEIAAVYYVLDSALELDLLRRQIITDSIASADQYTALSDIETTLSALTQSVLLWPNLSLSLEWGSKIQALAKSALETPSISRSGLTKLKSKGFSESTSKQLLGLPSVLWITDALYLIEKNSVPASANPEYMLSSINETLSFDWLQHRIGDIVPTSQWELAHQGILLQSIAIQKFAICKQLAVRSEKPEKQLQALISENEAAFSAYFETVNALKHTRLTDLTNLTVAINRLNFLTV